MYTLHAQRNKRGDQEGRDTEETEGRWFRGSAAPRVAAGLAKLGSFSLFLGQTTSEQPKTFQPLESCKEDRIEPPCENVHYQFPPHAFSHGIHFMQSFWKSTLAYKGNLLQGQAVIGQGRTPSKWKGIWLLWILERNFLLWGWWGTATVPEEAVDAPSLEMFKVRLDASLVTWSSGRRWWGYGWN